MNKTGRVKFFKPEGKEVRGGSKLYNFTLENDETWYGCGFDKPAIAKGQSISFEYADSSYGPKVDVNSIKVVAEAAPGGNASSGKSTKAFAGNARDDYWKDKDVYDKQVRQPLIMYQSATNAAVTLAVAALENGILPTAGTKKADKYASFMHIVKQIRDEVFAEYMDADKTLTAGESLVQGAEYPTAVEELIPEDSPEEEEAWA